MERSFELVLVDILITRFEGMGVCISAGITCKYSHPVSKESMPVRSL